MIQDPIELLEEVLRSPTHFKGARSKQLGTGRTTVVPYTAKRLDDDLIKRIRDTVKTAKAQTT